MAVRSRATVGQIRLARTSFAMSQSCLQGFKVGAAGWQVDDPHPRGQARIAVAQVKAGLIADNTVDGFGVRRSEVAQAVFRPPSRLTAGRWAKCAFPSHHPHLHPRLPASSPEGLDLCAQRLLELLLRSRLFPGVTSDAAPAALHPFFSAIATR